MHRLPRQYSVIRFRIAALLLLVKWVVIVGSSGSLAYALFMANRDLTHLAIILLGLVVPIALLQWLVANRARCPLCIGLPLAHMACATHRGTRRIFGSYRLRVAISVIFQGWFRCPYCGESVAIEVRSRPPLQ
jgi:hypothetical protein